MNKKLVYILIPIILILILLFLSFIIFGSKTTYVVSFDTDGGNIISSQKISDGSTVNKPEDPVKDGYTFIEWELDGESYEFDSEVSDDITLKAVYAENGSLTFSLDDLTGYYWYLDSHDYSYLYCEEKVVDSRSCLIWESNFIKLTNGISGKLIPFDNYSYDEYKLSFDGADSETEDYLFTYLDEESTPKYFDNIKIVGDKLIFTIGDKNYNFTKFSEKKAVLGTINILLDELTLNENEVTDIELEFDPYYMEPTFSFESSDSEICEITGIKSSKNGKVNLEVTSKKEGTCTLTVKEKTGNTSDSIEVTIKGIEITDVSFNSKTYDIEVGETFNLPITITPSNASISNLIITSSDENVCSASNDGAIIGVSCGTANITISTKDGKYSDTCKVTVLNKTLSATLEVGKETGMSQSGPVPCIYASVIPSGGTGTYTFNFKFYFDSKLIHNEDTTDTAYEMNPEIGEYYIVAIVSDGENEIELYKTYEYVG